MQGDSSARLLDHIHCQVVMLNTDQGIPPEYCGVLDGVQRRFGGEVEHGVEPVVFLGPLGNLVLILSPE
jgi:hypothetical protein